jgi:hypothetical protein
MANDAVLTRKIRVLGDTYDESVTISGDNAVKTVKTDMAAAKTGVLTTRTDDNTGSLTMTGGHGITTGQRLDVYWTLAGVNYARRGMTVGTVSTNVVPIDGGAGDVLPAAASSITAMVPVQELVGFVGDNATLLTAYSNRSALVVFTDGSDVELGAFHIKGNGYAESWDSDSGVTNPLAGDTVVRMYFSHGYSTGVATVESVVLYN